MTKEKTSVPRRNFYFSGIGNSHCGFHAIPESNMRNRMRDMGPMNCCGMGQVFTEKEELEWLKDQKEIFKDQLNRIDEEITKLDTTED